MKENVFFTQKSEIGHKNVPLHAQPVQFARGSKVDEIRDIKDIAKAVREYVKKKYPLLKFSVNIERFSGGQSMSVYWLEAPYNPLTDEKYWEKSRDGQKYFSVNQYHFENSEALTDTAKSVLKDVRNFYNQYNYNHSDPMTDYSNIRFYETLGIGRWDKGFVVTAKKGRTPKEPSPKPESGGSQPKYREGQKVTYKTSKGNESGTVISSKYIGSRQSFLYSVENPRGGLYNIWENNIVSAEDKTPEKPFTYYWIQYDFDAKRQIGSVLEATWKNISDAKSKVGDFSTPQEYKEKWELFAKNEKPLPKNNFRVVTRITWTDGKEFYFNVVPPKPETAELFATVKAYSYDNDGKIVVRDEEIMSDNELFNQAEDPYDVKDVYESFWGGKVTVLSVVMANGREKTFASIPEETPSSEWSKALLTTFLDWQGGSKPLLQSVETSEYYYVESVNKYSLKIVNCRSANGIEFTPYNYNEKFKNKYRNLSTLNPPPKPIEKIVVCWSENGGFEEYETFYTWGEFQNKLLSLEIPENGYDKTKIFVVWQNARAIIDRLDIGKMTGDFDPNREFVGDYLLKKGEAMYWSNFSGERSAEALWKDIVEVPEPTPESRWSFKVGDVFRRNFEGEEPPNTTITYTILNIGDEKTQYRIDYLDKGTSRLSSKSNEKITEEIFDQEWIPYEENKPVNSELEQAIEELRETNDAYWELYTENIENTQLRKELRNLSNDNSVGIKEFSADAYFNPLKEMNTYFERATKKFSHDNSELSKEEFDTITKSKDFKNWFGDWEKPIGEALVSKVVGLDIEKEEGKKIPLIVWHGTWNKSHYSRFKFTKFPIIYFATNKSYAEWFAKLGTGIMYQCFLDIKFLCDFRYFGVKEVTWSEVSDFLKRNYGFELPEKETGGRKMPVWAWIRGDAPELQLINTIKEQGFTGMAHVEDNPQDILPNGEKNSTVAYMIFSPEQAKLVRYVSSSNLFNDIFFMKKGGRLPKNNSLLQKIKNLKV